MGVRLALAAVAGCKAPTPTPPSPTDTAAIATGETAAPTTGDTGVLEPSVWTDRIGLGAEGFGAGVAAVTPGVIAVMERGVIFKDHLNPGFGRVVAFGGAGETTIAFVESRPPDFAFSGEVVVSAPGDLTGDGQPDVLMSLVPTIVLPGPFDATVPTYQHFSDIGLGNAVRCDVDGDGDPDLCMGSVVDRAPPDGIPDLTWIDPAYVGYAVATVFAVLRRADGAVGARTDIPGVRWMSFAGVSGAVDPNALPTWVYPANFLPRAVAAFDPDGDGEDDLLLCGDQDGVSGLRVLTGPDADPPVVVTLPVRCEALEVADFDGDGQPEVAVGGGSRVIVLEPSDWSVAATWVGEVSPGADGLGAALDAADEDGDGRMDLFAGAPTAGYVYLTTEVIPP